MKIVPQQSRILVELIEDAVLGNIALPENMEKPDYLRCRVVAVGPGRTLENGIVIEIPLTVGQEVVFDARFAARLEPECIYGGRKLAVIDYAGVQAVIEREPGESVYTPPKTPKSILRGVPVLTH